MPAPVGIAIAATFVGDAFAVAPADGARLNLREMVVEVPRGVGDRLPLTLRADADHLSGADGSAQVKSQRHFAGPGSVTTVIEAVATREITERMLQGFGAPLSVEIESGGERIIRPRGGRQFSHAGAWDPVVRVGLPGGGGGLIVLPGRHCGRETCWV